MLHFRIICNSPKFLESWQPNSCYENACSTSGTTASILLVRAGHAYIAHVGNSAVVVALKNSKYGEVPLKAHKLIASHKPDDIRIIWWVRILYTAIF